MLSINTSQSNTTKLPGAKQVVSTRLFSNIDASHSKSKKKAAIEWRPVKYFYEPRKSVLFSSRHPQANFRHRLFSRPTPSTDVELSGNHWNFSRLRRHTQPGTFYYLDSLSYSPMTSNLNSDLYQTGKDIRNGFSFEVNTNFTLPRKSVLFSSRHPQANFRHRLFSRPTPSTDVEPSGNHWNFSRLRRHTQPGTFYYHESLSNSWMTSELNPALIHCSNKDSGGISFEVITNFTIPRKSVLSSSRHPQANFRHRLFSRPTPSADVEPSGNHWNFSRLRRHTQPGTFYFYAPTLFYVDQTNMTSNLNLLAVSEFSFAKYPFNSYPPRRLVFCSSQATPYHKHQHSVALPLRLY